MTGALAAGNRLTAEAGADVLRAGGKAVDAAIAAAAVSWICESSLTGLGGGGFLLHHDAKERRTQLLDFFVAVPERPAAPAEQLEVVVDFGDSQQVFFTGPASVAVPGVGLGLWEAHARWGTVPWAELLAPAARLAREGAVLDEAQGYLHLILDPLLRHSPEGDALYGPGRALRVGERFAVPELADTLARLAVEGPDFLYRGDFARRIADHVPLTLADLARYEVIERDPLTAGYRGDLIRTNPPPAGGGRLLKVGLEALGDQEPTPLAIARAMEAQEEAGRPRPSAGRRTSASSTATETWRRSRARSARPAASSSPAPGSASTTCWARPTWRERNGRAQRLMSLMAPSLVLHDGKPRLVLGSAGSRRLHGALLQVVAGVVAQGRGVEETVEAPRVYVEGGIAHCEDPAVGDELEAAGYPVVRWTRRNLFFGGVSAVEIREDGSLAAAGDPRRGGAAVVIAD